MSSDKRALLLLYRERIKDIKLIMTCLNEEIDKDVKYLDSYPDSIDWSYVDHAFTLLNQLKRIREGR